MYEALTRNKTHMQMIKSVMQNSVRLRYGWVAGWLLWLVWVGAVNARGAALESDPDNHPKQQADSTEEALPTFTDVQLAFFEERIRPLLLEHCYECHSHDAEKVRGGVYLDSRAGVIDSYAAEPGDVENSLMIEAVHYADPTTQMPPDGKLGDAKIADLTRWGRDGFTLARRGGACGD